MKISKKLEEISLDGSIQSKGQRRRELSEVMKEKHMIEKKKLKELV